MNYYWTPGCNCKAPSNRVYLTFHLFVSPSVCPGAFYLLYSWTNPIFGKNHVREIKAQNTLNQSYCRILKSTISPKQSNEIARRFCILIQVHKNQKLIEIFLDKHGQKWVWPVWSWDSKSDCISRMNRWNKPIFCMPVQIQKR